jgi:hypothetical protein
MYARSRQGELVKSERNRRRENGRARWAAAVSVALALTMFVAVVARALTAGNVDGVWGNPTPSGTSEFRWCYAPDIPGGPAGPPTACSISSAAIQNPPGSTTTDENQVRWGTPSSGSGDGLRSGYGFNGSNAVGGIVAAAPFFLGRFTHYNRPITASTSFAGTNLTATLTGLLCDDGSVPVEGGTQSFVYTFSHEETSNSPPCAYGDSTGNGCNDRVTVNQVPATVFTCPEGSRTLLIQGFFTNASCHLSQSGGSSTSFVTGEGQDNAACLWASISAPPPTTTSSSTSTSSTTSSSTSSTTSSSTTTSSTVPSCGNGSIESGEACDGGACCTAACQFSGAGSPCGNAGTECTNQDTCDGSGTCVDNGSQPDGAACDDGQTSGSCDAADACTGGVCQSNLAPAGTPCGDTGTDCTNQDTCDSSGGCTDNGVQPEGTPCADDGNACTDDVCNAGGACGVPNSAPCNDADACTAGESCAGGTCGGGSPTICPTCEACEPLSGGCMPGPRPTPIPPAAPRAGLDCRVPATGRATLLLRNKSTDPGDKLVWKWKKWPDTLTGTFGDPLTTDTYTLCVFDGLDTPAAANVYRSDIPAGGTCGTKPCWRPIGSPTAPIGFKYLDKAATADGMVKLKLKSLGGPAKILLSGKGEHLPDPTTPLTLPVAVQMQTSAGECWGSTFAPSGLLKNDAIDFKARSE